MVKTFIFFILLSISIYAHPHVFFTGAFQLNVEKDEVKTLDVTVYLDEMNTVLFTEKIPKGKAITDKDLSFYKDVIHDLRIQWDGKDKKFNPIFKDAEIEDDSLKIDIEVPIYEKIDNKTSIVFAIYDTEYFYTYDYEKEDFHITMQNSDYSAKFSLKENMKKPFYYGMVYPKEYEVKFY